MARRDALARVGHAGLAGKLAQPGHREGRGQPAAEDLAGLAREQGASPAAPRLDEGHQVGHLVEALHVYGEGHQFPCSAGTADLPGQLGQQRPQVRVWVGLWGPLARVRLLRVGRRGQAQKG